LTQPSPVARALMLSVGTWILFIGLLMLFSRTLTPAVPAQWAWFVYGLLGTIAALIATWGVTRYEPLRFKAAGLYFTNSTLPKFAFGLAIGIGLFGLIILILVTFSGLSFNNNPGFSFQAFGYSCLVFIPLALMEEIAFRAYPFKKLRETFGLRRTQWIVALAFALYHVLNGWGLYVSFLGPFMWAFIFGLAAVWSKGIAVPTGIHVALNILQGFLGFKESEASFFILEPGRSPLIPTETGGIIGQILMLAIGILGTEYYRRKLDPKATLPPLTDTPAGM
jgi:uncharacterized protein